MGNSIPSLTAIPTIEEPQKDLVKKDTEIDGSIPYESLSLSSIPEEQQGLEDIDVVIDKYDDLHSKRRYTLEDAMLSNSGAVGRKRAMSYSPEVPENSPTVLTFVNLTVTTKSHSPKVLLKDISGKITGGLWAIMGSSGSGKTTLLSTLSLRLDTKYMDIRGEFRLNEREYSRANLKAMSAYVMQDDLLHTEFTVEETMHYAAQLRMSADLKDSDRKACIDEVLKLMGIDHTGHVIIGDARRKGIFGGERKRVCVAMELLNRPKLMFLDEPTSGLDSSTSFSVCKALKHLSDSGECTVVCIIHQPQPKVFRLFDNLILMKQGHIVYQGNAMKVVGFLENIDKSCPADENLADHLLNIVAVSKDNHDAIEEHKLHVPVDLTLGLEKPFYTQEYLGVVPSLFLVMTLVVTVVIAVFVGFGFWKDSGNDPATIHLIRPSVFFAMVNQGVAASLKTIIAFPTERAIMIRERQAGAYQVSSYFLARTTCDLVTLLWPPVIFAAICLPCDRISTLGPQIRSVQVCFCILNTYAATSLCAAVVCICVSLERCQRLSCRFCLK